MKRYLLCFILALFFSSSINAQNVKWTFETSLPTTSGPHAAEIGSGFATCFHAGASSYAIVVGNGSSRAFSSNTWSVNDYYQFQFGTTGFQDISITWDATSSNTGPRDFKVQYSTDGTTFLDAAGVNSTYQITGEAWSTLTYNPASTRTLDLSYLSILNNTATVYIRLIVTSTNAAGGGVIAASGTSRVDDFTVNGTVNSANTITITGISSTTFNLADCFSTATGSLNFSSTDIFNAGNIFTAQLSDGSGSFLSPISIGTLSLSGTGPSGSISITIPNGMASGSGYKIRIVSSDPVVYSNLSADITINQSGSCVSAATDYYRSRADGAWSSINTWESSPSGTVGTWIPATLTPTSSANTISIRSSHTVTIILAVTVDQVIIEGGGILVHSAGLLTINDDASGNDILVQNGAVFTLSFLNNPPVFSPATATVDINTGGTLRVSVGGLTALGAGVNSSNFIYRDASILELTTAFSTAGVTYFPNVTNEIPIFRTTGILSVGAGTNTVINGVFEANSSITFINAGTKTFRNGIRGTGNINGSTSGTFIINGTTAELGGTGSLTLPASGLQIGSAAGTTVTVTSNKTVTGDISLLSTNTFVELGSNNLTVTGNITGGGANAYIRTNGTGVLRLNTIDVSGKTFPIGSTSYNPLVISNGSNADYSARVVNGIVPLPAFPTFGVDRTWVINASTPTSSVNVIFQYALSDVNTGALPQPQNMEILLHSGSAWSIIAGNGSIMPVGGDPYTVNTSTALTINNSPVRYALGKSGGYILPIDFFITVRSEKRNNSGYINWNIFETGNVRNFEVQRSVNNGDYETIATVTPTANQLSYNYTDIKLSVGTNLYRIKVNRISGAVRYSNTVAIINDTKGLLITSVYPNPVNNTATITLSAARSGMADILLYDISGTVVYRRRNALTEGTNNLPLDINKLPAGVYHLAVQSADSKAVYRLVKQ